MKIRMKLLRIYSVRPRALPQCTRPLKSKHIKSLKIQVKKSSKPGTVSDSWWRHWDRDNPRKFAQTPHTRYYWRLAGDTLVLPLKWVCNTLNGFGIIDLTSSLLNLIETSLHLWWMISAAIPARPAFEEGSRTGSLTMIFGFQLTDFVRASLCSSAPNFEYEVFAVKLPLNA